MRKKKEKVKVGEKEEREDVKERRRVSGERGR